ncbi:conserved hypothetical protein [Xenorhabdus innexi]|nr:conserved hypothetical protein [Xenorhabdus innexi]
MPSAISIAILPNSPYGREMAQKAHKQGREILIHLPMAPLSKQPLEKNTLHPAMNKEEIAAIIYDAIQKVPYATGMNNHMGSAMTSSLNGMEKVMSILSQYHLYFLDSVTIGNTQVAKASAGTAVQILRRNIFLDNVQTEAETLNQLNRAIALARKQGSAIAIGHPYPTTIRALQQGLATLPDDIELVAPSRLLNHTQPGKQSNQQTEQQCRNTQKSKTEPGTTSEPKMDYLKMVGETLVPGVIINTLKQSFEKLRNSSPKTEKLHSAAQIKSKKDNAERDKAKTKQNKTGAHKAVSTCSDS